MVLRQVQLRSVKNDIICVITVTRNSKKMGKKFFCCYLKQCIEMIHTIQSQRFMLFIHNVCDLC